MPAGRPCEYEKAYIGELYAYLEEHRALRKVEEGKVVANPLPTRAGFARRIGVNVDSLKAWEAVDDEFLRALKALEAQQEDMLTNGGLTGSHNPTMAIFLLKNNHGYTDKTQQELSGPNGGPMQFTAIERVIVDPQPK